MGVLAKLELLGAGAFIFFGFLGSFVGLGTSGGFRFGSIAVATAGALLLLFTYRKFRN